MYVRMTFFKVENGKMDSLRDLYNRDVISAHKHHKGIRFAHLLECLDDTNEGISVTAWDTKADLDAYETSGDYERLRGLFNEMYAGVPTLKSYEVTASSEPILLRIF
jgi:heme-degrading monooxygenase HmoA